MGWFTRKNAGPPNSRSWFNRMRGKTNAARAPRTETRARVGSAARLGAAMNSNKRSGASGSIINQYQKNEALRKKTQTNKSNIASKLTFSTANIGNRNVAAIKRRAAGLQNSALNANNLRAKNAHKKLEEEYNTLRENMDNILKKLDVNYDEARVKRYVAELEQIGKGPEDGAYNKVLEQDIKSKLNAIKSRVQNKAFHIKLKETMQRILETGEIGEIEDKDLRDTVLFMISIIAYIGPFMLGFFKLDQQVLKDVEKIGSLVKQASDIKKGLSGGGESENLVKKTLSLNAKNVQEVRKVRGANAVTSGSTLLLTLFGVFTFLGLGLGMPVLFIFALIAIIIKVVTKIYNNVRVEGDFIRKRLETSGFTPGTQAYMDAFEILERNIKEFKKGESIFTSMHGYLEGLKHESNGTLGLTPEQIAVKKKAAAERENAQEKAKYNAMAKALGHTQPPTQSTTINPLQMALQKRIKEITDRSIDLPEYYNIVNGILMKLENNPPDNDKYNRVLNVIEQELARKSYATSKATLESIFNSLR